MSSKSSVNISKSSVKKKKIFYTKKKSNLNLNSKISNDSSIIRSNKNKINSSS